jgi:hypothetical protein
MLIDSGRSSPEVISEVSIIYLSTASVIDADERRHRELVVSFAPGRERRHAVGIIEVASMSNSSNPSKFTVVSSPAPGTERPLRSKPRDTDWNLGQHLLLYDDVSDDRYTQSMPKSQQDLPILV